MLDKIVISSLGHTWILDLDGTIVLHNGYKINGEDSFLEGAEDFLKSIPDTDMIIFITSRTSEYRSQTEDFLRAAGIRYDYIIFDAPYGERILINDRKPSGLDMSVSVNSIRDVFIKTEFVIDEKL